MLTGSIPGSVVRLCGENVQYSAPSPGEIPLYCHTIAPLPHSAPPPSDCRDVLGADKMAFIVREEQTQVMEEEESGNVRNIWRHCPCLSRRGATPWSWNTTASPWRWRTKTKMKMEKEQHHQNILGSKPNTSHSWCIVTGSI